MRQLFILDACESIRQLVNASLSLSMFLFVFFFDLKVWIDILVKVESVQVAEYASLDVVDGPLLPYVLCYVDFKLL